MTSAATSTHLPQSPSSPRPSPPVDDATTGNCPPKLWPPASSCSSPAAQGLQHWASSSAPGDLCPSTHHPHHPQYSAETLKSAIVPISQTPSPPSCSMLQPSPHQALNESNSLLSPRRHWGRQKKALALSGWHPMNIFPLALPGPSTLPVSLFSAQPTVPRDRAVSTSSILWP